MTLQGGKSRFTLQTLPAEDFRSFKKPPTSAPLSACRKKTLKNLISQVHFSMAVHDIRYYLNGILFVAEGKSLTLGGHRRPPPGLGTSTLEVDLPKQEVILPRKTVLELQRLLKDDAKGSQHDETAQQIEMRFAGNQAKFNFGAWSL